MVDYYGWLKCLVYIGLAVSHKNYGSIDIGEPVVYIMTIGRLIFIYGYWTIWRYWVDLGPKRNMISNENIFSNIAKG